MSDRQLSDKRAERGQTVADQLKLTRETLVDRLTTQLRQQVLAGRLAPGQTMPSERQLREAFGVGRTTVREALNGLVAAGFVQRRNNQLVVCDLSTLPEAEVDIATLAAQLSVADVFETRKALETKAVELAAQRWADDDLVQLQRAVDTMRHAELTEDYHAADVEFHRGVVTVAKNAVLAQVYESSERLFFKLPAFWRVFSGESSTSHLPIAGWEGHQRMLDAITSRDGEAGIAITVELLDRVQHVLMDRVALAERRERPSRAHAARQAGRLSRAPGIQSYRRRHPRDPEL